MAGGGAEALLCHLLKVDTSKVELRTTPKTEALADQVIRGFSLFDSFWYECLSSGKIGSGREWPVNGIEKNNFHIEYSDYCEARGRKHQMVPKPVFSKELRKVCSWSDGRVLVGDVSQRRYRLPALEDCRREFCEKVGIVFEWEE